MKEQDEKHRCLECGRSYTRDAINRGEHTRTGCTGRRFFNVADLDAGQALIDRRLREAERRGKN